MGNAYNANVCVVTVDPSGTPEVLKAIIVHYQNRIGGSPAEAVVLATDKRPKDVLASDYEGKVVTITVDGTTILTGTLLRCEKKLIPQEVTFTILDNRWKINAGYVGMDMLETLDTNPSNIATYGLPTSFTNGLPFYGADVVLNLNGLPNKNKSALDLVPPGYEHSTAFADYWRAGTAIEWLWTRYITPLGISYPLPLAVHQAKTVAAGGASGSGSFNITYALGVPWSAYSTDRWLTTTASGTGTGAAQSVAYAWAANADTGNDLSGAIVVMPSFGGFNKAIDAMPLFTVPVAQALDAIFAQTRCQWYLTGANVAKIISIDSPTATLGLVIPDPDSPTSSSLDALTTPMELSVEHSIDNAVGQVDIIGAKQQREITLIDTDFVQQGWFGIDIAGGWSNSIFVGSPYDAHWTNYDVERYRQVYINNYGWQMGVPSEHEYRYDIKAGVFESHNIGQNLPVVSGSLSNYQPYPMLGTLLLGRTKDGSYCNPDLATAFEGVSPLELLKMQYPDGCSIDLDRGYLRARGITPWVVNPLATVEPPYYGTWLPKRMTVAMEASYRAYQSAITNVSSYSASQVRRCVLRNNLINKTCEANHIIAPVVLNFDYLGNCIAYEGVPLPAGWTRNYGTAPGTGGLHIVPKTGSPIDSASPSHPIDPRDVTWIRPAGTIVDAMGQLLEIKQNVDPYVGIPMVNGSGRFPSFTNLQLGTRLTEASGQYDFTGIEMVTAVSFSDQNQALDFMFTNRLGVDITELAQLFTDSRAYQRPI